MNDSLKKIKRENPLRQLYSCIWKGAKDVLEAAGHDTQWVGSFEQDPGDEIVLSIAHNEKRVLVTLDKDFGKLAVVRGKPHCGIIHLVGYSVLQQGIICVKIIQKYKKDLELGAIITVEKTRVRIRSSDSS